MNPIQYKRILNGILLLPTLACLVAGCSQQAQRNRHLARAEKYFQQQQYREAAIEYMNVITSEPTNRLAIRQIGMTFAELGDARTALPYLLRAESDDPGSIPVKLKLSSLYLAAGQPKLARKRADAILGREPGNFDAMMLWASSASSSNEIAAAVARLDELAGQFGNRPPYHIARASLLLRSGGIPAAAEAYRVALEKCPNSWELHLALGNLHRLNRDPMKAVKECEKAVALAPGEIHPRLQLAHAEWAAGHTNQAKAMLESLGKEPRYSNRAKYSLAEIAFSERDYNTCLAILTAIMKAGTSDLNVFLLYQRVKLAQGKTDEAIAAYGRLVSAYPWAPEARYLLGLAWLQKGDARKAISEFERVVAMAPDRQDALRILTELYLRTGDPDRALLVLKGLTDRHPNAPLGHGLTGSAYFAKKNYAKAAESYGKLMSIKPDSPQAPFLTGMALLRQGNETEAVAMFEQSLTLDSNFLEPLNQLVALEGRQNNNWDAAISRIQKQIEKAPDLAGLHFMLGNAFVSKRDWDQAERAFQKAIALRPDSPAAFLALSQVYAATGKDNQALSQLDKTLALNTNDVASLMMKALILQRLNDTEHAMVQYRRILNAKPDFYPALNNLACLYWDMPTMRDKGYDLARQARTLAPGDPYVADTLGWMVYQRGDPKRALALLKESAGQLVRQPEVLYHLGCCYVAMGNEAAARDTLSKALETGRDFPGAADATAVTSLLALGIPPTGAATAEAARALLAKYPDNPSARLRAGAIYEQAGNPIEAQKQYEKILEGYPHYVPALVRLARLLTNRAGDLELPLSLAKQARDNAPDDPRAADALAWIAFKKGDHKWALGLLTESARQLPDDPEIQYHLGMAQYVSGKIDQATNLISRAVKQSAAFPGATEARHFLDCVANPLAGTDTMETTGPLPPEAIPGLMARASQLSQKGEANKARQLYERIVSHYAGFSPAIRELALAFRKEKNVSDAAFKLVSKAREAFPEDWSIAEVMGEMAYQRKQYPYAIQLLQACAARNPDHAEVLFYLGMSYDQVRNKEAARKNLRRALELDPRSEFASEAKAILRRL